MSEPKNHTKYKKSRPRDLMIDVETMGTRMGSAILVLAGMRFSRDDPHIPFKQIPEKDKFYRKIDLKSCTNLGMTVSESTIAWWKNQPEDIRKETFDKKDRFDISQVLEEFNSWCNEEKFDCVWSHGANFDIPLLDEAYIICGLDSPWNYWSARDTRTLFDLASIKLIDLPQENKHNAIFDCYRQIWGVKEGLKKMHFS